jgi:hypothetical protein
MDHHNLHSLLTKLIRLRYEKDKLQGKDRKWYRLENKGFHVNTFLTISSNTAQIFIHFCSVIGREVWCHCKGILLRILFFRGVLNPIRGGVFFRLFVLQGVIQELGDQKCTSL